MVHRLGSSLQQYACTHNDSKNDQHPLPTKPLSDKQRQDRPSETSQIINASHEPRQRRRRIMEILVELMANNDTTEDALFVAKKAHHGASGDGDGGMGGICIPNIPGTPPGKEAGAFAGLENGK